jgi:DNA topoisomerase-1
MLWSAGCGLKSHDQSSARSDKSVGGVGVVDLDVVAKRLGRDIEMANKVQEKLTDLNSKLTTLQGSMRRLYEEKRDKGAAEEEDENAKILPPLEVNMPLDLREVLSTQSFTKPPPRFTEASLVKELERLGIGRPSTYAAIMNKIQSRDYTVKESQALKPTELGKIICEMLEQNFPPIMDVTFTAQMEDQLEQVAEHNKNWKELIRDFWRDFIPLVEKADKEAVVPKILTEIDCPKCGHKLQKIWSRSKYFYGCANYPDCDYTAPIEALTFNKEDYDPAFNWDQPCPNCGSPMTLRHGRYGAFLGCSRYPDCKGIVNIPKKGEKVYSAEELPACPAIGCDGRLTARKSRFGKTFFSCTNFPDCDVIVSSLDQIEEKYDASHPKTPYVKKGRRGKFGKKGAKEASAEKKPKRKSTQPPVKLSPELAKFLGKEALSRTEVTKEIWAYIKQHQLQDPTNKRIIRPDAALAVIIGKTPIDMMKLAGALNKHFKK